MAIKTLHKFLAEHRASHTAPAIAKRLAAGARHSYLRDFLYGAIDGAVTTFAVVSGVAGAGLSTGVIVVLGVANLIADGFSMAASNFVGTRAEHQLRERARREELRHIEIFPEGEREEIRQIFSRKGFDGDDLEKIVEVITSDREQWVSTMLKEELGLPLEGPTPWRAALSTFLAFVLVGFLPLASFVTNAVYPELIESPFLLSAIFTGSAFFCVGALTAAYLGKKWYVSGSETFVVGSTAAAIAYLAGAMLQQLAVGTL